MPNYSYKPCSCGSGETHYPLLDAQGIFCCYVCEQCEEKKKAKYNPGIFEAGFQYDEPVEPEEYYGSQYDDWY